MTNNLLGSIIHNLMIAANNLSILNEYECKGFLMNLIKILK